ncbi:MAG: hypothetical protein M8857_04170 [marine benthic group bacterium]|nr:hypothetical protein [Gemmatimonadota bacterium]
MRAPALLASVALAMLSIPLSQAHAQVNPTSGLDTHGFGLSPADRGFGGADTFGAPNAFGGNSYGSPFAGPGRYTTCGGSVSNFMFMFGSAPGRSQYGWYADPFDYAYSRNWLTPWPPSYGFWAHHYGFGYGSRVGGFGRNPWNTWSAVRTGCGSGFGWGYVMPGWGYGPSHWGYGPDPYLMRSLWGRPYGPEWGYDYYPGSWRSYTPPGPPRDYASHPRTGKPSVDPWSRGADSLYADRERPGTRVIESRLETGGADLRKVDPRRTRVTITDLADATVPAPREATERVLERIDASQRETMRDAIRRSRARTLPGTEVVKIPLRPIDPDATRASDIADRAARARAKTERPGTAARTRVEPRSAPRAETGTRTEPRSVPRAGTTKRSVPRSVPRSMPRSMPSTRSTPSARSRPSTRSVPKSTPKRAPRSSTTGRTPQ